MTLRRTPGVVCQCQSGSVIDRGTNALVFSGVPGPAGGLASDPLALARSIVASVAHQMPVSMDWDALRVVGELARTTAPLAGFSALTIQEAVYGFAVRQVAEQYLDVRESGGDNRGKEVESMLAEAGGAAGLAWCAAFVYHCHAEAAGLFCAQTTCPRTLRAVDMVFLGREACNITFSRASVLSGAHAPMAGDVFVMVFEGSVGVLDPGNLRQFRRGHTGIVVCYDSATQTLTTIEGNTNEGGGRNGYGVFLRKDRMSDHRLWGFMRPRMVWP